MEHTVGCTFEKYLHVADGRVQFCVSNAEGEELLLCFPS